MVFRILSLDGGGIRGVITASILEEIEQLIGSPLNEHFDLIAGTSTGAIIAAGIAKGYTANKLVEIYQQKGTRIFPYQSYLDLRRWELLARYGFSAPKFSDQGLIEVLKEEFNETTLGELAPKMVLMTFYDTESREAIVLKSWRTRFANIPLWEACTCSASAPTFFPAHELQLEGRTYSAVDGGVYANNPVSCALAEAVNIIDHPTDFEVPSYREQVRLPQNINEADLSILSVGTGKFTRVIPLAEAQNWGALQWGVPLFDVFMDGSDKVNDYIVRNLIEKQDQYIRLQFSLDRTLTGKRLSDDIDDASEENINNLIEATKVYMIQLPQQTKDNIKRLFS